MEVVLALAEGGQREMKAMEDTFVSIRLGKERRQGRFEASRKVSFSAAAGHERSCRLDVFKHLGSGYVKLQGGDSEVADVEVPIGDPDLPKVKWRLDLKRAVKAVTSAELEQRAQQKRDDAHEYWTKHGLDVALVDIIREMLRDKPENPKAFLTKSIRKTFEPEGPAEKDDPTSDPEEEPQERPPPVEAAPAVSPVEEAVQQVLAGCAPSRGSSAAVTARSQGAPGAHAEAGERQGGLAAADSASRSVEPDLLEPLKEANGTEADGTESSHEAVQSLNSGGQAEEEEALEHDARAARQSHGCDDPPHAQRVAHPQQHAEAAFFLTALEPSEPSVRAASDVHVPAGAVPLVADASPGAISVRLVPCETPAADATPASRIPTPPRTPPATDISPAPGAGLPQARFSLQRPNAGELGPPDEVDEAEWRYYGSSRSSRPSVRTLSGEARLRVTIERAMNLRNADWLDLSDPYCVMEVMGVEGLKRKFFRTKVIDDNLHPVWEETYEFDYTVPRPLHFTVWDKDIGKRDDFLGRATLTSDQFWDGFDGYLVLEDAGKVDGKEALLFLKVERLPDPA